MSPLISVDVPPAVYYPCTSVPSDMTEFADPTYSYWDAIAQRLCVVLPFVLVINPSHHCCPMNFSLVCIGGVIVFASCMFPDQDNLKPGKTQLAASLAIIVCLAGLLPSVMMHFASASHLDARIASDRAPDAGQTAGTGNQQDVAVESSLQGLLNQAVQLHLLFPWLSVMVRLVLFR